MSLGALVNDVAETRAELRRQGASQEAIDAATERLVRHHWEPLVPDQRFWPTALLTLGTCAYCDGTGLVIHRDVKNRLGHVVDEGVPCRCSRGARFLPPVPEGDDFQQAGKTPKPKAMSRFGR